MTTNAIASRKSSVLFLASAASNAVFLALLCSVFQPRWETNDDIAMSMVAHGYGLAATGSPNLIFSNVVWGMLVRAIPPIYGVQGYSVGTLACLFLSGTALLYFLQRLDVGKWTAGAFFLLVLLRPILFPQFTVNAGLLSVAACVGLMVYHRHAEVAALLGSAVLATLGFLIRSQEFVLVFAVALPMLPWKVLRRDRPMQLAVIGVATLICLAVILDMQSYQGSEWRHFLDINIARAPFTDFGAGSALLQQPGILARHDYSINDVNLISSFFFVDPQVTDPATIRAMLSELGTLPFLQGNLSTGLASLQSLLAPAALPLIVTAVVFLYLSPRKSLLLSWCIFLLAVFSMGISGRGGILRVYFPLLTFLAIAALTGLHARSEKPAVTARAISQTKRLSICLTVTLAAAVCNYLIIAPQAALSEAKIKVAQADARAIVTSESIVSWGVGIPIESIFPVLASDGEARRLKIYPFGVFTHAPFSVSHAEELAGHGFMERLRSPDGVPIVAYPYNIDELRIWCKERLNSQLRQAVIQTTPSITVQRVWCPR